MDLRVERTKRNIYNAFIELRSKKPLEKITVTELAKLAYINKATFYSHYQDIYDLSDKIENEIITSILKTIPHPENIVTNSGQVTIDLTVAFTSNNALLNTVFSGSRAGALAQKIDYALKKQIYTYHPEYKNNLELDILFTILIQGGFYASISHSNEDIEKVSKILGKINDCLISEINSIFIRPSQNILTPNISDQITSLRIFHTI